MVFQDETPGAVVIWHNPACGTSRAVLAAIRTAGIEPAVVEYLTTPPARADLVEAIAAAGLTPRSAARAKEKLFAELGLSEASDEQILDAMIRHPVLINRPFVFAPRGVRLCRPAETVQDVL
ncbi:arsenate reductase (glutaredoxin) [Chenggangzhangella methanolivorans]|uniref:Arsenate reductase n=1 Tax=Chenggangzhangella methanolivorans TaxID=1437009 RepID=A0A9E6UNI5_9HYPH|nr:arsenate reductase (glutaredoxin) [Chenggangzhangella methanolivorans]QZO01141.1 arsenate reductase (glutaredoxin) [Chenggangzhangella methanolivorans]